MRAAKDALERALIQSRREMHEIRSGLRAARLVIVEINAELIAVRRAVVGITATIAAITEGLGNK